MDHGFSPEFMEYVEEEERLVEAGTPKRPLPNARLAVIEGAGHLPPLERRDESAALVRSFLSD
jgi:pimeloyl-ACP methyl ester carboxylesterase